jgi:hypothetical protein
VNACADLFTAEVITACGTIVAAKSQPPKLLKSQGSK